MLKKIAYYFNSFMTFSILGVFGIVAGLLHLVGKTLHLTYNEVNVLLYYLFIPLTWFVMIDHIIRMPIFSTLWLLLWSYIFITKRRFFRQWCDVVFDLSVEFLLNFQRIGWDYYKASVIVCVICPVMITWSILLMNNCHW